MFFFSFVYKWYSFTEMHVNSNGELDNKIWLCFRSSHSSSGVRLTGDPQADADIMAFVKARQNILQQSKFSTPQSIALEKCFL